MMAEVVSSGTGTQAAVPGYPVAGKTGTARKPQNVKGNPDGYKDKNGQYHYVSTFAGFVPADKPDLSIIVVIDEPTTSIFASDVAAPLFSRLASYSLRLFHIPPPSLIDSLVPGVPPVSPDIRPAQNNDVVGGAGSAKPQADEPTTTAPKPTHEASGDPEDRRRQPTIDAPDRRPPTSHPGRQTDPTEVDDQYAPDLALTSWSLSRCWAARIVSRPFRA